MEVDAGFAKTGLKSVTKLHSSTFLVSTTQNLLFFVTDENTI
jgi:hypothetical protein